MYFQDIIISPDIIECIKNFFLGNGELINFKDYIDNLKNKKLILDKNKDNESIIEQSYFNLKESSIKVVKDMIDLILKPLLLSGRIDYKILENAKVYQQDSIQNVLLNLAINTESKIINTESKTLKLITNNNKELTDIEILDIDNFINPTTHSIVFANNKVIRIERGAKFLFEKYFIPYLCDAENININDRYLRKRNGGFLNLLKILKLCKSSTNIEIYTILRDGNPKDGFDMTKNQFENEINKISNCKISLKPTNSDVGKMRYIKTENYNIDIEPGFDFVDSDYVALNNPVVINISKIRN